ncbi:MAG TPA: hypothetical protein VF306_09520 [Pirellulales bacterium]
MDHTNREQNRGLEHRTASIASPRGTSDAKETVLLGAANRNPSRVEEDWRDYLDVIRYEGEGGATTSEPPAPRCH